MLAITNIYKARSSPRLQSRAQVATLGPPRDMDPAACACCAGRQRRRPHCSAERGSRSIPRGAGQRSWMPAAWCGPPAVPAGSGPAIPARPWSCRRPRCPRRWRRQEHIGDREHRAGVTGERESPRRTPRMRCGAGSSSAICCTAGGCGSLRTPTRNSARHRLRRGHPGEDRCGEWDLNHPTSAATAPGA
jgi:hypothetical protein